MNYVDVEYPCFTITASNNGGGNNGGGGNNSGNNSGGGNNTNNTCGNDPNLTDLMVYIDPSAYVNSGDPVYAYYDINCTIIYNNYTLEVSLSNSTLDFTAQTVGIGMKPITMNTFQKLGLISILDNTVSMLRFGMYPMVQ